MAKNDDEGFQKTLAFGIIESLREHGIKYIFGIPDGHTLPLYDAIFQTEGIEHILVNDERTAAFAADAYARITGTLGVCDAGAAGSMNFPVAIAEANGSASPVLAIVGTVKSEDLLRNVPHDINIADTFTPITKWSKTVMHAHNAPRFFNYALRTAVNGRPGPVVVVFPEDILSQQGVDLEPFMPITNGSCSINGCRTVAAQNEISEAVRMIQKSEQPAIFAGGGAVLSGTFAEISKISRMLKAPVFSTITGKGVMIEEENYMNNYFGTVGLFGEQPNHKFLKRKTDLVIAIGNRLTEDDTGLFKFPVQRTPMVHIDIDAREIGLSYRALGVVGDPKATLRKIIESLKNRGITTSSEPVQLLKKRKENLDWLRHRHEVYRRKDNRNWMETEPIKPQRVLLAISKVLDEEDYLVTDASASSRWIGAYFRVKSLGRKIITPRGVGPTGFGLGALIGTHFALKSIYGNKEIPKIVLITGDGGLMNAGISDFETIKKYEIDCTIVVLNNKSLGFVKYGQGILYNWRFYETNRGPTPFTSIAQAFGANAIKISELAQLDKTIEETVKQPGFNLIDVSTDPDELLPRNFYV